MENLLALFNLSSSVWILIDVIIIITNYIINITINIIIYYFIYYYYIIKCMHTCAVFATAAELLYEKKKY
jgi:hypothetical protein